eukprot:m.187312 g.187312  ORF g.187312 m.187312 type:complete len:456 (+) comp32300_c0_seq2:230-1597(+)
MFRTLQLVLFVATAHTTRIDDIQCNITTDVVYNSTQRSLVHNISLGDCCDLCTFDAGCVDFSFHPQTPTNPTWCQLQNGDGVGRSTSKSSGFASGHALQHRMCDTAFNCSLAGDCVNGTCVCDGWTKGDHCEVLNLMPADPLHFGYRNSSGFNSWGGASISFGSKWYLFVSQIQGKCLLSGYWSTYSLGMRLESDHPMGPFENATVVLPSFAHNVKPFQAPDGMWLLYYIGAPNNKTITCENTTMTTPTPGLHFGDRVDPQPKQAGGPIMIASASSPTQPAENWEIHGPITDTYGWHSATNPSPVFFKNGSVFMAVSRRFTTGKFTFLMHAENWRGPYTNITKSVDDCVDTGEDPDMFRTARGYHMLNHNSGPGSTHLEFSVDGTTWFRSPYENAFTSTVAWANGSHTSYCQRQRPQIVMADDGLPGWFWSGVGDNYSADCTQNPTWTLAQQIGR